MRTLTPRDADDVRDIVAAACTDGERLEIVGSGRCREYGRPVRADVLLDLSALSGVVVYEPAELVMSVRAATSLAQIHDLLRENRQHLAFEPPDFGPLWGKDPGCGTIGGCLMLGLGGSRRATGGAPRDHFLGLKGVNGHAQIFAAGGRVVKNVTGFDLPKLFAGSLGTLGVLTEVTLKVMPRPERTLTVAVAGLSASEGLALLARAAGSPAQASGGAFLTQHVADRSKVAAVNSASRSVTLLRLEGFSPSVEWSVQFLTEAIGRHSPEPPLLIETDDSLTLWKEISSVTCFADDSTAPVWRVSVESARAANVAAQIESLPGASCYIDCFGGVIWARVPDCPDAGASVVRGALESRGRSAGHATLVRASEDGRERIAPFQPLESGLAALTRRVKAQFDPRGLFNPGRMYEGV